MLNKTSTDYAPWFIIPSDHKWFRNLAVSRGMDAIAEAKIPILDLAANYTSFQDARRELARA